MVEVVEEEAVVEREVSVLEGDCLALVLHGPGQDDNMRNSPVFELRAPFIRSLRWPRNRCLYSFVKILCRENLLTRSVQRTNKVRIDWG